MEYSQCQRTICFAMTTYGENSPVWCFFIHLPPIERILIFAEWCIEQISTLRICCELCLICLRKCSSDVRKYLPTSRNVRGFWMPGGTFGGSFAGSRIENHHHSEGNLIHTWIQIECCQMNMNIIGKTGFWFDEVASRQTMALAKPSPTEISWFNMISNWSDTVEFWMKNLCHFYEVVCITLSANFSWKLTGIVITFVVQSCRIPGRQRWTDIADQIIVPNRVLPTLSSPGPSMDFSCKPFNNALAALACLKNLITLRIHLMVYNIGSATISLIVLLMWWLGSGRFNIVLIISPVSHSSPMHPTPGPLNCDTFG